MNSFVLFLLVLFVVNVAVTFLAKSLNWYVWLIAAVLFTIFSPIVLVVTKNNVGRNVGDGIAGAVAGLTFGGLLIVNAIIFITVAFIFRKKAKK